MTSQQMGLCAEGGALARTGSPSSVVRLTPELETSALSLTDESTRSTPGASFVASEPAYFDVMDMPILAHDWDALVPRMGLPYPGGPAPALLKEPVGLAPPPPPGLSLPTGVDVASPASWMSSSTMSPSDTGATEHTQPPSRVSDDASATDLLARPAKRSRTEPPPSHAWSSQYQIPALLPMAPRALPHGASDGAALRAWLVERRALLHKAHDDVVRDMAGLQHDKTVRADMRARLTARMHALRQRSLDVPPAPAAMPMLKTHGGEFWDPTPVSSMADLLEQNILYL